jgi:Lon protease-like protein
MIADAAAGHQCIGMALLKDGWEDDYAGNPPIFSVGCVGRLISLEPLPDGRSNILLQGLERFSVEEEFADRPYREARVRWRPTEPSSGLPDAVRADLARWLEAYVRSREDGHRWRNLTAVGVHDEILINGLATYLAWTPVEKQLLLEADGLEQRARRLIDLLRFALDDDRRPAGWN